MKTSCPVKAFFLVFIAGIPLAFAEPPLPTPTAAQYTYHEQERIMFVCLDPCTWQGREYDDHSPVLDEMILQKLNTDQWCEAAASWGAKQILFVAKHTGGFCWWQTDTADYSVKSIPWKKGKGDLLVELVKSCAKYNLNIGIYVYPGDDTWGAGIGSGGKTKDPAKQEAYNKVFRQQLRECLERAAKYVPVTEVWFDGSCVINVNDILEECAPNAAVLQGPMASIRWVGNEAGRLKADEAWSTLSKEDKATGLSTSVHSNPDGDAWAALEVDITLYDHNWFWAKRNEKKRKSLDELVYVYYQSVGQGAVMLLNSTPNTDGLIPEGDIAIYKALGKEIDRRFENPLSQTSGEGDTFELNFNKPTLVNHIDIMEDYKYGERVRAYIVEGFVNNEWKILVDGEHVGRKTIRWFDDTLVSKLRLRITKSAAQALITQFAAYRVTDFKVVPTEERRSIWQQCTTFNVDGKQEMEFDLTPFITEVGQWQVQFQSNSKIRISDQVLYQSGQASTTGILKRDRKNKNTFNINRTAVITERADIRLKLKMKGDGTGRVVIRKR